MIQSLHRFYFFSKIHPVVLRIYKILIYVYSKTLLQVYIYYLLWATGFCLSFRPSSGPFSNLKCCQGEMLKYKLTLLSHKTVRHRITGNTRREP